MPDVVSKSCLLIIDYQNFFASKNSKGFVKNSEKIKPPLRKLIEVFTAKGLPVIATRHFNEKTKKDPFFRFYGKAIEKQSFLFQLSSPVNEIENIKVIDKSTYSPFFNKIFIRKLREKNIENIFLAGFLLEKCVLSTSFDAFQRGYNVFVIKECVMARDRKNEKAYFNLINRSCGKVISYKEIFDV